MMSQLRKKQPGRPASGIPTFAIPLAAGQGQSSEKGETILYRVEWRACCKDHICQLTRLPSIPFMTVLLQQDRNQFSSILVLSSQLVSVQETTWWDPVVNHFCMLFTQANSRDTNNQPTAMHLIESCDLFAKATAIRILINLCTFCNQQVTYFTYWQN